MLHQLCHQLGQRGWSEPQALAAPCASTLWVPSSLKLTILRDCNSLNTRRCRCGARATQRYGYSVVASCSSVPSVPHPRERPRRLAHSCPAQTCKPRAQTWSPTTLTSSLPPLIIWTPTLPARLWACVRVVRWRAYNCSRCRRRRCKCWEHCACCHHASQHHRRLRA